jgi:hypothetical protein
VTWAIDILGDEERRKARSRGLPEEYEVDEPA